MGIYHTHTHTHLSHLHAGAAVQTQVDVSVVVEELLQHVQHPRHLGEDEHPVAARLQPPQQRVEGLQLACTHTLRINLLEFW